LDRGESAYVWDLEGNKYIDYTASTGAILLGYRNRAVENAVLSHMQRHGTILPTTISEIQVALAEHLVEMFPCAERAFFFRTGSCATTAAVRLARVFKSRPIVLTSGYHGWHDWHLHIFPRFEFPDNTCFDFRYNLNLLEYLLHEHAGEVACVIITPEPTFFDMNYFRELEQIVRENDVLLIFDEVVSGFRYSRGGFQSLVGVTPDLATIGKGLASGYPLSAVIGRADVMSARNDTHLAGTFHHEQSAMVAAKATLDVFDQQDVIGHLSFVGERLINGLRKVFEKHRLIAWIGRFPGLFHIILEDESLAQKFYKALHRRGILMHPFDAQMVTYSHTTEDIDQTIAVADAVLTELLVGQRKDSLEKIERVSRAAWDYRTLHEIGGLTDFRLPISAIPATWQQDDR
jgi:glutamate-1-semialdehyde aminotransferase